MNLSIEKIITLIVITAFIVTCINSLSAPSEQISKEAAIETSKGSSLVKRGARFAFSVSVGEANYYNASVVERLKLGHKKETYEKVPESHTIWQVVWDMHTSWGGYLIIVLVDAEAGKILHEETGVRFG